MRRISFTFFGVPRVIGLALAVALALVWATVAYAQSADDQYGTPVAPSGPAAGEPVTVLNDAPPVGEVSAGDILLIEGDFAISAGSSTTVQDSDGTQGTFVDGENATITEGSIRITVTGDPTNVNGGDGVLNTTGLFVVATTGVSAKPADAAASGSSSGSASSQSAGGKSGVLPATGGSLLLLSVGVLAVSGAGLVLIGRRRAGRQQ